MFKIDTVIDAQRVANLIVGAFEGGSTYWLRSVHPITTPEGVTESPWYADGKFWAGEFQVRVGHDNPNDGPDRVFTIINRDDVLQGLRLMAEKSPRHTADFLSENDDAETSDVFWQYVVLKEIVFG